jgi:hypothetical protein
MQASYPLKIQAIRSKGQQARLYVYFPLPLAAAIGLEAGEDVQRPNSYALPSKTDCQRQTASQSQPK